MQDCKVCAYGAERLDWSQSNVAIAKIVGIGESSVRRHLAHKTEEAVTSASMYTIDVEMRPGLYYSWGPKNSGWLGEHLEVEPPRLLSWAAKKYGVDEVLFYSEYHDGTAAMIEALFDVLEDADVLITYNGDRFDMAKMAGALSTAGYARPSTPKSIDLIKTMRKQGLSYKSLGYSLKAYGLGSKLAHEGFKLWEDCIAGDAQAWATMKEYNIQDVVATEQLYTRMRGWVPNHPNLGLYGDGEFRCPVCLSDEYHVIDKSSIAYSRAYVQYRCDNPTCRTLFRSDEIVARTVTRPS